MKTWYDKKAREQTYVPGDQVLLFLPVPGSPLRAKFVGPYSVLKRLNSVDYAISTPDWRRPKRVCHVNMMKPYYGWQAVVLCVDTENNNDTEGLNQDPVHAYLDKAGPSPKNSMVLQNLGEKLGHLSEYQQLTMSDLIQEYRDLFTDAPGRTTVLSHNIVLKEGAAPVKQHPYRLNPMKADIVKQEIQYMMENNLIEPSDSPWSSPVLLVPKPDKTFHLCIDFRKVNALTKVDSYPLPRVEDCIDRLGNAGYVSKYDLLKGYWQVPLTESSKEITAFVTPDGLYQCKVLPFGLKNAPSVFSRLMNKVLHGLEGCTVFIDDVAIVSPTWTIHLARTRKFFERLRKAKLTVNLAKSEVGKAKVTYLGYTVGQGEVVPKKAKVEAIQRFPVPTTKKHVMQFLGVVGYYRKFCKNFAEVSVPLTDLLCKSRKFEWLPACQTAFEALKQLLMQAPILLVTDYRKPFKLFVDASEIGVGALCVQLGSDGIDHPIAYFSKKLNKYQCNYSTIEKEALALILAVQHFEIYVSAGNFPVEVFTDHNPLKYLYRFKNKNQRLTRWSLFLQGYHLQIAFIKGKDNLVADFLSRHVD